MLAIGTKVVMTPSATGLRQQAATAATQESVNPSINPSETPSRATPAISTDGAVGVGKRQWFVGYVPPRAEKKLRDNLLRNKLEAYAAVRNELHTWRRNERRIVESVIIPCVVFIKTRENELDTIQKKYCISSFMRDVARRRESGKIPFAIITDSEMALLQSMLRQTDYEVAFSPSMLTLGEHVRVLGFDADDQLAQIVSLPDDKHSYVGVRVGFLGCAYMKVPADRIVRVKANG